MGEKTPDIGGAIFPSSLNHHPNRQKSQDSHQTRIFRPSKIRQDIFKLLLEN